MFGKDRLLSIRIYLAFALFAFASHGAQVLAAPSSPKKRIDFRQALQLALEKSPDYDVAIRSEFNSRLNYKNSWSVLLPEVDLKAQNGYANQGGNLFYNETNPATPWSNLFSLNIAENLYDNGLSWRLMKIADLNRRLGSLNLQRGRQLLLENVAKSYYDFSESFENISLQRQEIESLRKEFRTIEGRYHQGQSSNRDFLRIKAQLQRSEVSFANQEFNTEATKQTLSLAVGQRENLDYVPMVPVDKDLAVLDFPEVSPEDSLDFQIAHLQDEVSDLKYRSVVREDWPRLSLTGSYSYNVPQYVGAHTPGVDDPYWNLQGMLVVDYALWDWGIRGRNVEIADNQRNIEKDAQETVRVRVSQDLNKLKSQIALLKNSYNKSIQILKDEEEVYASLNRGYRDGKVTYLELITSLSDLYSSRSQYLGFQYSLLRARASLAFYQGNLDDVLAIK